MKKLIIYTLFSLAFMFLFSSTVSADVIPPNSHSLDRCVKIVNLDKFPDIYLIGYITGPMVDGHEAYIVKNGECLSMGYKFNQLTVLAVKKSYIDSIGINNLQISDKNIFTSDERMDPYGGYVDQSNPLIKEDIEYSIAGYSSGKLSLYKSKQTSEYNNDTPEKVETFNNPLENEKSNKVTSTPTSSPKITPASSGQPIVTATSTISTPEPVRRGFWQSIICFFEGLFGKGCQ